MKKPSSNMTILRRLMLRLLPVQILLAAVGAVNGIVSSYFASNYVGITAMSAVGLFAPVQMLITSFGTMLAGGSVILCGQYMGRGERDRMQNVFSLDLAVSVLTAILFTALFAVLSLFDLTGFLTKDPEVRRIFNRYLLGQAVGVFPLLLGSQFPAFLALENKGRRTTWASIVYIAVNVALNLLFVRLLRLEAIGLALASALGLWVFLAVEAQYYFTDAAQLRITAKSLRWRECADILRIGFPGAASSGYQTLRGLIVNRLLETFVGSVGISAFAAANNLLGIFWAIPAGMTAVSRLMISVSIGEEDRQTLTDVTRVMFRWFVPMMYAVAAFIILCAGPFARIFFRDTAQSVYMLTVWGFRILPLCMPLSTICLHFITYGQASGKNGLVHTLAVFDGVVSVAGFTALMIRTVGMNSVYIANVLNGVVTTLIVILYAWGKKKHFPRNMDELMAIPDGFGVPEAERMDLTVRGMDEVVAVARQIQEFCRERGVDERRAYIAGLCMEEMAGNIVEHGFSKGTRSHVVDVRVVHKDGGVILRVKDDCVPFDPLERQRLTDGTDPTRNVGLRLVFNIAESVQYQNIFGLNVLTIRI